MGETIEKARSNIQMLSVNDGFYRRLRTAREFRGMSQKQLAQKCKLPESSISHFEAGDREPSLASFRSLVNALNVDPEYLLMRSDFVHRSIPDPIVKKLNCMMKEEDFEIIEYLIERFTK